MIFIIKHNNNNIFRIESVSGDCGQPEGKIDRSRQTDSSDCQRRPAVQAAIEQLSDLKDIYFKFSYNNDRI